MRTLGICFGATSVQYAVVLGDPECAAVEKTGRIVHDGNPAKIFLDLLDNADCVGIDRIAVTGRAFRSHVALTGIPEPEAIETALAEDCKKNEYPDLVVSLGGETQLVYKVGQSGGIVSVHSGNKCASGTGEFFLQQIRRMGLSLDEAVLLASDGVPHKIAGRCSVFCKSDCTHALNKGEPKANIVAGLCVMIADKITDLIKDMARENVMLIGGGALNSAVVNILSQRFHGLRVPETAAYYEAYGAALWAMRNECLPLTNNMSLLVKTAKKSFGYHAPLANARYLVDFSESLHGEFSASAQYVLGLDVGSTTTKAVLLRCDTKQIVASVYLRTSGDPVAASRSCYAAIFDQIDKADADIAGLGITGSGRQIAGLHAQTDHIVNEIVAHAKAAAFCDKDVDTIFEIGGQDAKYTFLTAGIPSDYAMNEACSAGTGSFLEESALESLNVRMEEIGDLAMHGDNPPNFTDQCAAFIASDITLAAQEGVDKNNIVAGLVYSICLNYLNRVKGARPVGKKIFMQGGVCYNKAVPVAMASLLQTSIIVPPDPGLMGAFGVALEVDSRIAAVHSQISKVNLPELIGREATTTGSFVCAGGSEHCDRKCVISQIRINGAIHPFGGMCNKYYNLRLHQNVDTQEFDLVAERTRLLYETFGAPQTASECARTVGLLRSFLTHSLYPLYSHFFSAMGFKVILSDAIDEEGISRIESAYCLPAEITHGSFYNLLSKNTDYIFLPQVMQLPVKNVPTFSRLCVFVQGEPYYLSTTFRCEIEASATALLSPVLKMESGYAQAAETVAAMAVNMGINRDVATVAWQKACDAQCAFESALRARGTAALDYLRAHPDTFGLVLFGRPYNAFAADANMGIPHKIASRGYVVIPHDMIPSDDYEVDKQMFWAMGQKILKSAQFVKDHPQLFGVYITNFSCGPDSFLLTFFRNIMKEKPSLTLELDQHTADAGIDTRIEAAIDIMRYHTLSQRKTISTVPFRAAWVESGKEPVVHASDGSAYKLTDNNVEIVLPSMGRYGTESIAAVMRSVGIDAKALPVSTKQILLEGRKNTSCKECLPYILTTGSFLDYLKSRTDPDKITLCFMASGGGPCRLGQYCTAMRELIDTHKIPNVAMLPMTNENGYAGLGTGALLSAAQAIMTADVFSDIRSFLSVAACDKTAALDILESCWQELLSYFDGRLSVRFSVLLSAISHRLSLIPLCMSLSEVPVVSLVGEIYVRQDEFSRKNLVGYLEKSGFMVKVAPVAEYLFYSNYVVNEGLGEKEFSFADNLKLRLVNKVEEWWERRIKSILSRSGCYRFDMIHVEKTMQAAKHLINENFRGECILTIGLGLREILSHSCGVVSIGPFGCMPSRVAEAVLKKEMNADGMKRMLPSMRKSKLPAGIAEYPFLAIETDGSPFPQITMANLESFVVQVRRVHESLNKHTLLKGNTVSVSGR